VVKEAVGEWAAELFVEEHEHEGDPGSFVGEPAGVAFAIAFRQPVRFHFAEIDVNVEAPGLKTREAVGYPEELCAYRLQLAEAFLKAEVREVVGADFIAQERGELLVLFDECVRNAFFQYARKM
jgi:hypothetical protein